MQTRQSHRERGAAAVEMALILPLLLLIVGGIIDFGRFFYTQNIVVNAAREGARSRAMGYTTADSDTRISQSLTGVQGGGYTTSYWLVQGTGNTLTAAGSPPNGDCPETSPGPLDRQRVTVTVTGFSYIVLGPVSRLFGGLLTPPVPAGTAEMRCSG
jgi:Flp pilus assembly protein TadG